MKIAVAISLLLCALPCFGQSANYLNLDTLTPASGPGGSSPGWNINDTPADTGGVNTPTATSQTIGNSSPAGAPSGVSMLVSETTPATSTQTNTLFWYYGAGCDGCVSFIQDEWIYITNIAAANNIEIDFDQYNLTLGRLFSFGHQCHIGGFWQYANNSSGWQNTSVSCSLTGAAWHHIIWTGHRIAGDTSCSGSVPCNHYDNLTVDGTTYLINTTLPSEVLPGGYPSALIDQFQVNAGSTSGSAATVSYNLDEVNISASTEPWSGILLPTSGAGICTLTPKTTYAGCGIQWQGNAGIPGGIPSGSWTKCATGACTTANSAGTSATCAQLQSALNLASSNGNQYVLLASGTYDYSGVSGGCSLTVGSNSELRGAGPNLTIIKEPTSGVSNSYIVLGSTSEVNANSNPPTNITAGATAGSGSMIVASTTNFVAGGLSFISELNNPITTDIGGDEGSSCTFCFNVYNWPSFSPSLDKCVSPGYCGATRVRGQLVHIDTVNTGTKVVTFDPPLPTDYGDALPAWTAQTYYGIFSFIQASGHIQEQYANLMTTPYHCLSGSSTPAFSTSGGTATDGNCTWQDLGAGTTGIPQALAFTPNAKYCGVQNLQIFDQGGGEIPDINSTATMYCWVYEVEVNYTDGDWTFFDQAFEPTILSNYFSNGFLHGPGSYDETNDFLQGTTGALFENNICERGHVGCVMYERGTAGNVAAYNYSTGNFDDANYWSIGSTDDHGATPAFNLLEGNVWAIEYADSVWGNAGWETDLRNWLTGTNSICSPTGSPTARTTVSCTPAGYPGQAGKNQWYSYQNNSPKRDNFNSNWFSLVGNVNGSADAQVLVNSSDVAISQADLLVWFSGLNLGYGCCFYGETYGLATTADSGNFAMDTALPHTTALRHGIYSNVDGSTIWQSPITQTLPPSFFLTSKPSFWGSTIPWPAIGPDITGGTGPGGHTSLTASNPAQNCYLNVMGGVNGGAGSPLTFIPNNCYGAVIPPSAPGTPSLNAIQ